MVVVASVGVVVGAVVGGGVTLAVAVVGFGVGVDVSVGVRIGVSLTKISFSPKAFAIDQTLEGSVVYSRDVFLRVTLKHNAGNGVSGDLSAVLDVGTKRSPSIGLHHLAKVDFKATLTENGTQIDEKLFFFKAVLKGAMNDFSAVMKTSCPEHRLVKLNAKLVGGKFESEFVKNDDRIGFEAALLSGNDGSRRFEVQSSLESTFHSFQKIELVGKLDLGSSAKSVEILAKSGNGEYHVELKSILEDLKGQLKVTAAVVPVIGLDERDFQVRMRHWVIASLRHGVMASWRHV